MDKTATYSPAIEALKEDDAFPEDTETQQSKSINHTIEQDYRFIKRRVNSGLGVGSFNAARHTIRGDEAMSMIRKDQSQNVNQDDVTEQISFIHNIFGIAV